MSYADPFSILEEPYSTWAGFADRLRRTNWVAAAAAIGVNAAFFALLITSGVISISPRVHELSVLNILRTSQRPPDPSPPSPPKEQRKVQQEQPKTEILVPVAKVPTPTVQTVVVEQEAPKPLAPAAPAAAPSPTPAPAANPGPVSVANINTNLLSGTPPTYPIVARRKREQGIVVLSLVISEAGRVTDIDVEKTSGFPALDDAAVAAVRGWRWSPTIRDGKAVKITGLVRIPFVLKN